MSAKFLQGPKGAFIIVDYIVSLLAIPCNCIILESLLRSQFSLTGYRRFLISLTVSDLYICTVNLLTFLYQALTSYTANVQIEKCGADILRSLMFVGFFANLLNLCGMSVDHLIGILYPLRYRYLINKRVARTAVALIWILSILLGFADFPVITLLYLQRYYGEKREFLTDGDIWPSFPKNSSQLPVDNKFIEAALLQILGVHTTGKTATEQMTDYPEYSEEQMPGDYQNSAENETIEALPTMNTFNAESDLPFFADDPKEPTDGPPITAFSSGESFRCILPADIESLFSTIMGNGTFGENNTMFKSGVDILKRIKCNNEHLDWCTFYLVNNYWQEIGVISLTLVGAIFLVICYGRIFKEVFANIDSSRRNLRKLVMTTFLLLGTFTFCWLPFMTFEFGMLLLLHSNNDMVRTKSFMSSTSLFIVHNCLNSILICYPLMDPLIYYSRVPLVQRYLLCRYFRRFPCVREYLERSSLRRALGKSSIGRVGYTRDTSHPQQGSILGNTVTEGIQLNIPSIVIEQPNGNIENHEPSPVVEVARTGFREREYSLRNSTSPKLKGHHELEEDQNESYDQLVTINSEILPLSLYPPLSNQNSTNNNSSSLRTPSKANHKRKTSITVGELLYPHRRSAERPKRSTDDAMASPRNLLMEEAE